MDHPDFRIGGRIFATAGNRDRSGVWSNFFPISRMSAKPTHAHLGR